MAISNPSVNIQILPATQVAQNEAQKILFLGQKLAAGTAPAGDLVENIDNSNEQNTLFGEGSILATMITAAKAYNKISRFDAIPIDDDGSANDATGVVAFSGAPTAAGSILITIGSELNHTYTVSIVTTDTPTTIGDKLVTLITADTSCPVTAVNVTGTVTLTAKNGGLEGNFISLRYSGTVAGVTTTLTAFSGGANNPSLDNVLDVVANLRYQTIVFPSTYLINDTNNNIITFLNNRFNISGDKILDGVGIMAVTDTEANLKAATYGNNSQNVTFIANRTVPTDAARKGSSLVELDYVIASQFAAIRALRLTTDAPIANYVYASQSANDNYGGIHISTLPYHNTPFVNLPLIDNDLMWLDSERSELKEAGWTILGNNVGNTSIIADSVVTRYKQDAAGDTDLSYKYLNYVDQASNVREYFHNNLKTAFRQTRLSLGDLVPGYNMANEGIIRSECMKLYAELADLALVPAGETAIKLFRDNLTITITEIEGKVTIVMLDPVVTQLRQIVATMQLTFSLNS
ncbi:MAG: hypothetical protein PVJ67_03705 [Candidatus Pacearchaeota archaeon]|jgi:phage tail sheath gpL-like